MDRDSRRVQGKRKIGLSNMSAKRINVTCRKIKIIDGVEAFF